jgi:hypothetical protein
MNAVEFYGQQDDERVLYKVRPHQWFHLMSEIQFGLAAVTVLILFWFVGGAMSEITTIIRLMGLGLAMLISFIGWWVSMSDHKHNVAYITDRRVIRFIASTPWTVNSRSIMWDEVVKIKTIQTNFIWRMLNIGSVVVHARSTVTPFEGQQSQQIITNDDIVIAGVGYYRDLGNYMDKVLYLYKKEPEKLSSLRSFVAKPRGKRY